jgi:hypothetical protein
MASIGFSDGGFTIRGRQESHVPWSNVAEIVAFKVDCGIYDTICLGVRPNGSDDFIILEEDSLGYKEFVAELERRFNLLPNWWSRVAFPAFAENWTRIWPPLPPTSSTV